MLQNTQVFLLFLFFIFINYYLISPKSIRTRKIFLIICSIVFIFALAPYALLNIFISSFVVYLYINLFAKKNGYQYLFMGLVLASLPLITVRLIPNASLIYTLGITFYTLKLVSLVIKVFYEKDSVNWLDYIFSITFFPTYTSGPIFHYDGLKKEEFSTKIKIDNLLSGSARLVLGLFKSLFLCATILQPWITHQKLLIIEMNFLESLIYVMIHFFLVYMSFSSYSDIAIGCGRLLGLIIPENFNHPYKAKSIMDFWQRWHITMGQWAISTIYMNSVRHTGRIFLPIIFTFTLVGAWHSSSLQYLLWGLAHGILLAINQYISRNKRKWKKYKELSKSMIYQCGCNLIVLLTIAILSAFANTNSISDSISLLKNLIGL